jgi:predicted glycoside hydrolase/deacetylase ChbG (UPF0249 family)
VTKYLIVNADGYGFTRGINRGIDEAVERGIVTSISVNSNYEGIDELPAFAERFPQVSVGVHLNPVVGPPIADPAAIPSLLGPGGEFLGGREFTRRLLLGKVQRSELKHELHLQVERVRAMGIEISHLDSHQNRHLYPRYFGVFLELMRDERIRCMRTHAHFALAESAHPRSDLRSYYLRHPHRFATHATARAEMALARRKGALMCDRLMSTSHTGDKAVQALWSQLLRNVPDGWTEVYCHPAFPDDELRRYATYVDERRAEVDVMTSEETRREIERSGIQLRTFHDLARART